MGLARAKRSLIPRRRNYLRSTIDGSDEYIFHTAVLQFGMDGLKGFPEAIAAVYPRTEVQLCIVHLVRASLN